MKPIIYTAILITAFTIGQSRVERYNLINQETIAYEKFKTTPAYAKQQGYMEAYAGIIDQVYGFGYDPEFLPPERKPI
jgi:hypothetical protein